MTMLAVFRCPAWEVLVWVTSGWAARVHSPAGA